MASSPSTQRDLINSNWLFLNLAMKLDSSLHPKLNTQLKNFKLFNKSCALTEREELIPVGSCMDGSKINIPTDYGDIDILLVPRKHVLDEKLFNYDPDYPAFLHVRGEKDHAQIFKNVQLVNGHVPVMVLKQIQRNYFHLVSLSIYATMSNGIRPRKDRTISVVKRSGVGLEFVKLDVGNFDCKDSVGQLWKHVNKIRLLKKSMDSIIDVLTGFWLNKDEDEQMQTKTCKHVPKECSVEHEEIDPEDGEVTIRYDNNLDIDEPDESYEDNDDSKGSMPLANESNFNDGDPDDQSVSLPKLMSADFVPAFKFDDWPRPAAEWKTRKRQWPSEEIVQKVVECGCHIVSKRPLFSDLNGDPTKEDNSPESDKTNTFFRLSFSRCELILANSLTESQKYCWRVLKAYQKKYLGTEPKVLASYHWKNIVFWVSEETDPSFWTEDNVLFGVCKALDFMIKCLRERFIPVYFVRNENLIAGCRQEVIEEALAKVISIRNDPIGKLQFFLENPPQSPPYRVSRTELTPSPEKINRTSEYVVDVIADLVRQVPENARDEDFLAGFSCKMLELWQEAKTRINEHVTSNQTSVVLGNVDHLIKQIVDKHENKSSEVGDSIAKTAVKIAGSMLPILANKTGNTAYIKRGAIRAVSGIATAFCEDKPVDPNKVVGGFISFFTSTIDDRL
ncbi:uncharacterized protein LOC128232536 [Mya arenaria]|uniref:uncharacterized protein LOC128232536 n=1 Tax=Mya arenaria TaxID=6604 RepID=UPI0022E28657|nr:uncharacterized protein LOC128232536 [Mya arenaria]